MAKRLTKKRTAQPLEGAGEFLGADPEKEAIEKIAAARAAAEQAKPDGDNGGPLMDENAWRRASNELVAEQLEIDELMSKVAEVRGRISSIKKVAEKCGADWDVVKLYAKYQKRIRIGESGEIVTEQRRLGALMKLMDCPLHTQFGLWPDHEAKPGVAGKPGMDAELQGQHAQGNNEPISNNPFTPGTEDFVAWEGGWNNAMAAKVRKMGPPNGEAAQH